MTDAHSIAPPLATTHEDLPPWLQYDWSLGQAANLACLLEASAPKAGNVHPRASFRDMNFVNFLASGCAISPVFNSVASRSVGELILAGVKATRAAVGLNTNLGTLLLLAPVAKAVDCCRPIVDARISAPCSKPRLAEIRNAVQGVLQRLTTRDSHCVYEAIRLANPGGLGSQSHADISGDPPPNLIAAMAQVADRDAVARQFVNGYADIFDHLLVWFIDRLRAGTEILSTVCFSQVLWMVREPDGLIVRKCGIKVGQEVQRLARLVMNAMASSENESASTQQPNGETLRSGLSNPFASRCSREFDVLDSYLRADGNRRNPGTTADLLAVSLFVLLVCDWS